MLKDEPILPLSAFSAVPRGMQRDILQLINPGDKRKGGLPRPPLEAPSFFSQLWGPGMHARTRPVIAANYCLQYCQCHRRGAGVYAVFDLHPWHQT